MLRPFPSSLLSRSKRPPQCMLVSNAIDRAKGKQTHIPNCEREQRHRLPRLRVHPSVRILALSSLRCNRASAVRCSLNAVHSRRPRPGLRRSRTRDASASFEHPASAAAGASRGVLHIQSNAEDGPCQGPCQELSRSRSQPPRHSVSYDVVLPPPRLAALAFSHIPRASRASRRTHPLGSNCRSRSCYYIHIPLYCH